MIDGVFRTSVDQETIADRIDARHFQGAGNVGPFAFETQRQNIAVPVILKCRWRGDGDARFSVIDCDDSCAKKIVADDANRAGFVDIVDNIKIDTVESNLTELKRCVLYKIDIYPAGADAADGTFCIRVQPKAASDALVENGATRAGVKEEAQLFIVSVYSNRNENVIFRSRNTGQSDRRLAAIKLNLCNARFGRANRRYRAKRCEDEKENGPKAKFGFRNANFRIGTLAENREHRSARSDIGLQAKAFHQFLPD